MQLDAKCALQRATWSVMTDRPLIVLRGVVGAWVRPPSEVLVLVGTLNLWNRKNRAARALHLTAIVVPTTGEDLLATRFESLAGEGPCCLCMGCLQHV